MDKYAVLFIKTSLLSFIIASGLGMEMAIKPSHASYFLNAHVHLNLLGFMAMMIFGVGYHVLPRFSGLAIHSRNLLVAHYYLGASTLAGMALCWIGMEMTPYVDAMRTGLIISGAGHLLSILLFAYNIFRSIKPVVPPKVQPQNN
jgi:cbb3-type cytochrome oxidase subunit 1